jgi:hypothetical protein
MLFLFSRRYPYLAVIIGAGLLILGLVRGSIGAEVAGCLAIVIGGYGSVAQLRRRGMTGGSGGKGLPR